MQSLRKLMNKPRPDDWAPLAKFYYADETLNEIASELDSFDGRRDPERCNLLVNKLRVAQDRVLHIIGEMLLMLYPRESDRACRDFRVKFPDELVHDNLPGQLWFGAECLAAGSNIIEHESESDQIRPLAKELTKHLDVLRDMLKDQSLKDPTFYTDVIKQSLIKFDNLFAEFEFQYVSAMVPVKSSKDHDSLMDVAVLFSTVLDLALQKKLLTQEQIDYCDPCVMFIVPRLSILWGLMHFPDGALNVDGSPDMLSEMFRPFGSLLIKIRNLLVTLTKEELDQVERVLCQGDDPNMDNPHALKISDFRTVATQRMETDESPDSESDQSDQSNSLCSETEEITVAQPTTKDNGKDGKIARNNASVLKVNGGCEIETRARFRSASDLLHRLFVCISGVADQLQTNFSSDVRKVLKMILQPSEIIPVFEIKVNGRTAAIPENEEETGVEVQESLPLPSFIGVRWVPDEDCEQCTACYHPFTMVRRRHHCRNCGRIFCHRCSSKSCRIPELGYDSKVRVCNLCYLHKMNPFGNCAVMPPPAAASQTPLARAPTS